MPLKTSLTAQLLPTRRRVSFLLAFLIRRRESNARHLFAVNHELLVLLPLFNLIRLYYLIFHPSGVVGQNLEDLLVWHENVSRGELNLILLALSALSRLDLDLLCLLTALLSNLFAVLLSLRLIINLKKDNFPLELQIFGSKIPLFLTC